MKTYPFKRAILPTILATAFIILPLRGAEPPNPALPVVTNGVHFSPAKTKATGLKRQINAGSRSATKQSALPVALVPEGLGLSSVEQPVLWWFLSEPTKAKVEFTLNRSFETMVKIELPNLAGAGLQKVDLGGLAKDLAVKLAPGAPYEWTVRVKQGDDPAEHPVTIGWIEYRPLPAGAKITTAPVAQQPALFAAEGYWYDAVTLLAAPRPSPQLQPLLQQVGLTNVVVGR